MNLKHHFHFIFSIFLTILCVDVRADNETPKPNLEHQIFDSAFVKRIWGNISLTPSYSASLTYSSVIYYFPHENINPNLAIKAEMDGVDISFDARLNNWHALEFGAYYGSTGYFTIESDGHEVGPPSVKYTIPMSDISDMREISVLGFRSTLIVGLNIQKPGIRIYGGVGLFAEVASIDKVNGTSVNDVVSGLTLRWGVGYTWETLGIEFWGSVRSSGPDGFEHTSGQGGWRVLYNF